MKINLLGNIIGATGYALHTRQLANALFNEGLTIRLEAQIPQEFVKELNDNELKMIKEPYTEDMIDICISLPPAYPLLKRGKKFIGFVVWESNKIPNYWIKYLKDCDLIFVPSEHTKNAILNTAQEFNDKIKVIPHGVNVSLFMPLKIKRNLNFTLIMNKGWSKGWNDRGGVQFAIKAFNEEFSKEENVNMLTKINPSYLYPGWNLQQELQKLNLRPEGREIGISAEYVPFEYLPTIYSQGDCFVCPTMGEGWGLQIGEAMACELPAIVTNWGGQTDFVKDNINGRYIDSELIDIQNDIIYEGQKWAQPNIRHLRGLMRWAFNNQDLIKQMGKQAREDIVNNWTWSHSAQKVKQALEELK